MSLPSGYTPLEYIESTGSQYIETRYVVDENDVLELRYELTEAYTNSDNFLFGSQVLDGDPGLWCTSYDDIRRWYARFGYTSSRNTNSTEDQLSGTLQLSKGSFVVNGTELLSLEYSAMPAGTLSIFARRSSDGSYHCGKMKCRGFKITRNGTFIRNYIPVQRLDGAVGLLDKVNNVFYPDAAGGNFIAGPLAAKPEAPASLDLIGTTRNAVVLAWPGAPVGQSYRLYRDGVVVYEGSALCYTDAGLASGSAHVYSVHTLSGSTESEGVTTEATTTDGIVLITDRTAADVYAGRRKGYYNALDLIRVGEAMSYLEERFADVGISVTVSPKLDWQLADIPTQAQALHYLEDIDVLRGKLLEYRETVSAPDSLTSLTWGQANDIETIFLDAEKLIQDIILSYRYYSGRAISGVNALP